MVPERPIVEIAKSLELYLVARALDDLTSPTKSLWHLTMAF
jgi:hypothetical protein